MVILRYHTKGACDTAISEPAPYSAGLPHASGSSWAWKSREILQLVYIDQRILSEDKLFWMNGTDMIQQPTVLMAKKKLIISIQTKQQMGSMVTVCRIHMAAHKIVQHGKNYSISTVYSLLNLTKAPI
jgi:hypothetical protein